MPDIWMDVDTAVIVPANIMPLIDDSDFKTIEEAVVYNSAGIAITWNFATTAGVVTGVAITPTTGDDHDWSEPLANVGMYAIEIPASGGDADNDTEGVGWITGVATGVLPWRGPTIGFRAVAINNSLIDGALVDVNVTAISDDATAAATLELFVEVLDQADGQIDAGTFHAGAIDAAAIKDAAIDAATFAAGAINAAAIAADAIDASALKADAVTEIRSLASGTADSGTTTTLVDAALTQGDDYWNGCWLLITSGTTANQVRLITDFATGTDTITVSHAFTAAVDTNTYEILPAGGVSVVDGLLATAKGHVNAEVLDVMVTDTHAEPAQGTPGATVSLRDKIGYLYKFLRNKNTQTATLMAIYNDDASTVDHKSTVSDDGTTATRGEFATGP